MGLYLIWLYGPAGSYCQSSERRSSMLNCQFGCHSRPACGTARWSSARLKSKLCGHPSNWKPQFPKTSHELQIQIWAVPISTLWSYWDSEKLGGVHSRVNFTSNRSISVCEVFQGTTLLSQTVHGPIEGCGGTFSINNGANWHSVRTCNKQHMHNATNLKRTERKTKRKRTIPK